MRALVACASRHGSTREVADAIGQTLRAAGLQVDVRLVAEIDDVFPYRVVVVGSAVYRGRWQREAIEFLERFETELATRDSWLFSSGPVGPARGAEAKPTVTTVPAGAPPPAEVARRARRIGARGHATFGGRVGDDMTGFLERWMPRGDWRDFEAIRHWAEEIAREAETAPD